MEEVVLSTLVKGGTIGGYGALLFVVIKFFGSSQKDATTAYQQLNEERAKENAALKTEIAKLNSELAESRSAEHKLRSRVSDLERTVEDLQRHLQGGGK